AEIRYREPLLDGKVALVTGAAGGIGRAIAAHFAAEGATVVVADVDAARATAAAADIPGASAAAIDVTDSACVDAIFAEIVAQHGRLDILVNNAGIDNTGAITEMSDDQWERMIAVNLTGVFHCTRAAARVMIPQKSGRIISIGSNLGMIGSVGMPHYCAAKAGVHGFMRAIARELAPHGITANTIAPGPINTEMLASLPADVVARKLAEVPLGRAGSVDEIAPTAVLLASAGGAYYTGAVMNATGGDVML
ncbi:SDR family NAD(P)-dependent oxidoreductase, partial [Microbacterium sp. Leaf351]